MEGENYFTYIAICSDESYYIGITSNILEREKRHNLGFGSSYTKKRLPIKIVYQEKYRSLKDVARREKQIKGWTKKKKNNLIKFGHPTKI